MYTQNTPVHINLWHHDFWRLAFANLAMTMAVYMLIPLLPVWMGLSVKDTALVMGSYGVGLFLLGGFCNFLVQHYRRNMVCVWALVAMIAVMGGFYLMATSPELKNVETLTALRVVCGAAFGLAQMVLMSMLVIDTSESFRRTEANHSAAWFERVALALGPLTGWAVNYLFGAQYVFVAAAACCFAAVVLILLVDVPFKAPEDVVPKLACDRFFLKNGSWLFLNMLLVAAAVGMIFTAHTDPVFYGMMMVGFVVSMVTQRYVFENAELKSEIISGLFLIGAAELMMLSDQYVPTVFIAPTFIGIGVGIVGARFLLFFIKLSDHCQRGTSQSSYVLGWETGVALGLFMGCMLAEDSRLRTIVTIAVVVVAFLMYHLFTHNWYLKHKNR